MERLCIEANEHLPEDVKCAIRTCREKEDWEIGRDVLDQIIENFEIADMNSASPSARIREWPCVFLEIGQDVHITGGRSDGGGK